MFEDVLRFWLDRGVDGFRIDVAHGLFKEASLRDQVLTEGATATSGQVNTDHSMVSRDLKDEPMWDQPEVHDVYRRWSKVLDEYGADRMAVAEAWTQTPASMAGLRPTRRARPGVQLRLAARGLVGRGVRRRHHRHPGGRRARRLGPDLGAVQPRRRPPHHPLRRRRRRAGPRPRGDADDAGAARARPTSTRARSSAWSRSTSRPRTGRTRRGSAPARPAATAAGCRCRGAATRAAVRLRAGHRRSRGSRSRRTWATSPSQAQAGQPGLDAGVLPYGAGGPPIGAAPAPRTGSSWSPVSAATCSRSRRGDVTVVLNCGPAPGRAACRRGRHRERPGRRPAARQTRRSGCAEAQRQPSKAGVVAAEGGDERVQLLVGPVPEPVGRAARGARSPSSAMRRRPSSVRLHDPRAAVVGVGLLGRQPELDEVLDLPADRALVQVERLDDRRGPHRPALGRCRPASGSPPAVRSGWMVRARSPMTRRTRRMRTRQLELEAEDRCGSRLTAAVTPTASSSRPHLVVAEHGRAHRLLLDEEQQEQRDVRRTAARSGTGDRSPRRTRARRASRTGTGSEAEVGDRVRVGAEGGQLVGRDLAGPHERRQARADVVGDLVAEHRTQRRDADRATHRAEERDDGWSRSRGRPRRRCSARPARGSAWSRRGRGRGPP